MNSELIAHLPPAFILIFGGLLLPIFETRGRQALILALPLLALIQSWSIPAEAGLVAFPLAGIDVYLLYLHPFTKLFATIFCLMAFAGGLFGLSHSRLAETSAAFVYAGGALGVVFSGDLLSFFFFWELMAIASTVVILCGGTQESRASGLRYAYLHFVGGAILLCGITSYIALSGHSDFTLILSRMNWMLTLTPDAYTVSLWLMFIGILINTATAPLSAWLSDSYPQGSTTGSVFLSAYTTKTAVFALLILFSGNELLIYLGLFTAFYGLIYAILENNIRRALSYGLISQVGVMVAGIGIGSEAALTAVALVAFGHILYKGLWFMVAGTVIESTGRSNCNELGMLYPSMKPVAIIASIATLSMAAPFTVGFIGKSLLSEAAKTEGYEMAYLLFTASAAGMFLVLLRLLWQIFFGTYPASLASVKPVPTNMLVAMGIMAAFCIVPALPGVYSWLLFYSLPNGLENSVYNMHNLLAQTELLLFSGLVFLLILPKLKTTTSTLLDFDWIYRVLLRRIARTVLRRIHYHYWPIALAHSGAAVGKIIRSAYIIHGPKGIFSRSWNISTTVLWSVLLLGVYMALYYSA